MIKHILTTALLLSATAAPALDIKLGAGLPTGDYYADAKATGERLAMSGHTVSLSSFRGSDEISIKVCSGEVDAGWMQADAIYKRANSKSPCLLTPIKVFGKGENAILMVPPKSKIDELDDVTSTTALLVGPVGSGSDLWQRTAKGIEQGEDGDHDAWSDARLVNDDVKKAHTLATYGAIDALLIVARPNAATVNALCEQGWRAAELWDRDIDDLKFNGAPLYTSEKVAVCGRMQWTYHVNSFIAAEASADDALVEAIFDAIQ